MRRYAGIALISSATLMLELALTRVFSVQQFYHFAFMALSLALLGAGASGSLLTVWGRSRIAPPALCVLYGVSTIGAYLVINNLPFDSYRIAYEGRQVIFLAVYFLAAALPFLFAGLLVGAELARGAGSHRAYGANLIGAALGSAASLPAMATFGGEGAVILAAIVGAASAPLFAHPMPARRGPIAALTLGLVVAGSAALATRPAWLQLMSSPYKTLPILVQAYDAQHVVSRWSASSRVDVVESSTVHVMPGLSLNATERLPTQAALLVDGDGLMPITGLNPDVEAAKALADSMPVGIAFRLRPGGRALVLEAGTGLDVLLAVAAGSESVTVVEENRLIIETLRDDFAAFTHGLYDDPRVSVEPMAGRVFVRQPRAERFDLIIVSLADPHRPVTSGAFSLTENYVYTTDAVRDYLTVLEDDGLLVMSRWLQTPPSESVRTVATVIATLRSLGWPPEEHLLAFRTLRTMTILVSRQPLKDAEIESARRFLEERGYDAVAFRGARPEELNRFNRLPEPVYAELVGRLLIDLEGTVAGYRFDIRPPTDDRPFFYHFFRWRQTPEIMATLGLTWQPFGGSGYFVLVALLILVVLASAVLIIGPLLWRQRGSRPSPLPASGQPLPRAWRLRVFGYFAALGLAFLLVEVPLSQRFILLLDEPVIALAAVLATVLLFSGLGSLTVRRWRLARALAVLVAVSAAYPLLLEPVSALALSLPAPARVLTTVLAMAPLGYLMGLPFAGGLAVLERLDPGLIPWAWAINGSVSVVSAVLAVLIALSWGFSAVLWLGAGAYGLALVAFGGAGDWKPG